MQTCKVPFNVKTRNGDYLPLIGLNSFQGTLGTKREIHIILQAFLLFLGARTNTNSQQGGG